MVSLFPFFNLDNHYLKNLLIYFKALQLTNLESVGFVVRTLYCT
jgi:hypothetical protein